MTTNSHSPTISLLPDPPAGDEQQQSCEQKHADCWLRNEDGYVIDSDIVKSVSEEESRYRPRHGKFVHACQDIRECHARGQGGFKRDRKVLSAALAGRGASLVLASRSSRAEPRRTYVFTC